MTRGKPWSVDEERQLRNLVAEGKGLGDISGVLGKTRVSVKAKLFNLGLGSVRDATGVQKVVVASSSKLKLPERALVLRRSLRFWMRRWCVRATGSSCSEVFTVT